MLGWLVLVLQPDQRLSGRGDPRLGKPVWPVRDDTILDKLGPTQELSRWEGYTLAFLSPLIDAGDAVEIVGRGYPSVFTAKAQALGRAGALDIIDSFLPQQVVPLAQVVADCDPEEWLVLEVWDLS